LYLVLAWVHAVVQERLAYVPMGWTEKYEFTEADATHALDVIDSLVDQSSGGRQQLDPEKLPWDAIRATLCRGVFGGRVTQDSDQCVLDTLVNGVFNPKCFDVDFKLGEAPDAPTLPDATDAANLFHWIEKLQDHTPPTWIGLGSDAEMAREQRIALSVVNKVALVTGALDQ
jgi:dynein heavy chain 1